MTNVEYDGTRKVGFNRIQISLGKPTKNSAKHYGVWIQERG